MKISEQSIISLQKLFLEQYGIQLPKEAAYEEAVKLFRLMKIIYRPMKDVDLKGVLERQEKLSNKS